MGVKNLDKKVVYLKIKTQNVKKSRLPCWIWSGIHSRLETGKSRSNLLRCKANFFQDLLHRNPQPSSSLCRSTFWGSWFSRKRPSLPLHCRRPQECPQTHIWGPRTFHQSVRPWNPCRPGKFRLTAIEKQKASTIQQCWKVAWARRGTSCNLWSGKLWRQRYLPSSKLWWLVLEQPKKARSVDRHPDSNQFPH